MKLTRVCYGKESTPKDMREYRSEYTGTKVGTLKEFKEAFPITEFEIKDDINENK